jgi:hypothetical protein
MNICEECGEVHDYDLGDRVRLVQNHLLTGQVIDERGWGTQYRVRLGGTVSAVWFDAVELEPDPDFMPPMADEIEPSGDTGAPTAEIINLAAVRAAGRG